MPRIFRVVLTTAFATLHFVYLPTDAAAQSTTLVPSGGSGVSSTQSASSTTTQMQVEWPNCSWALVKPYPMWSWLTVNFRGDRDYGDRSNQSGDMDTSASITLKGDFLTTQTLTCRAINYGVEAGPIYTPYGTEYTVQHDNPACNGHPTLNKSPRPRSTYWISEELYNTSGFLTSVGLSARRLLLGGYRKPSTIF
jgi:hypothetical protein